MQEGIIIKFFMNIKIQILSKIRNKIKKKYFFG